MTVDAIRFGNVPPELFASTDAEFLAALKWRDHDVPHRSASNADGDLKTVGLAWKQQCLEHRAHKLRHTFATLDRVLANEPQALPAALAALRHQPTLAARTKKKSQTKTDAATARDTQAEREQALREWLSTGQGRDDVVVLLGCLELLLFQADQLAAQTVGELWRWSLSVALNLSEQLVEIEENDETEQMLASEVVLRVAVASGLLPWLCGLFFDDVKGAPKLAKSGRKSLTSLFVAGTEDSGNPVAAVVRGLSDWLALWTDAMVASRRFDRALWKDSYERRFNGFLRATTALTTDLETSSSSELLGLLAKVVPEQKPEELWREGLEAALNGGKLKSEETGKKKETASWQSDTCSVACLRTSWSPDANRIVVLHDGRDLTIDMTIQGRRMFVGDWKLSVLNNGQPVELTTEWECCCWYSDKDVDYAEWTATATDGVVVGRSVMLHRRDEYAVLADVIKNAANERVDVTSALPFATGWSSSGIEGSREQRFSNGSQSLRVFPLMLPQDVGFGTSGRVEHQPGEFTLATAATGGGLFSPIVLDWNSKRRATEAEWRELTVSEAGKIDHSSGRAFRMAIAKHNLLFIRGLRKITRYRTALGYQTWNETVIASLNKDGIFDEILLVEQ